jgi:sulfur-carrier protein
MRTDQTKTKILFYGRLADLVGRELELTTPQSCSIAELRTRIAAEHPGAAEVLRSVRVRACVGDSIVPDDHPVTPGDQIEFLSPVSGG